MEPFALSDQFTKPILNKLSQLRSAFAGPFSFENARAAKKSKYLHSVKVELVDRYQVEEKYSTGTWQRQAYDDFTGALVAKDKIFPCIYGTKGYKANELDFVFFESSTT